MQENIIPMYEDNFECMGMISLTPKVMEFLPQVWIRTRVHRPTSHSWISHPYPIPAEDISTFQIIEMWLSDDSI